MQSEWRSKNCPESHLPQQWSSNQESRRVLVSTNDVHSLNHGFPPKTSTPSHDFAITFRFSL